MHCMAALKVQIEMPYLVISHLPPHLSLSVLQASEEGSLQALESVMTEFFHSCTTNDRKREIGEHIPDIGLHAVILQSHPLCSFNLKRPSLVMSV